MKHTYLYPLDAITPNGADEEWMWRASRSDAVDLFGDVHPNASTASRVRQIQVSDVLSDMREAFHKQLETRDRICIGRSYVIPGSLCDVARERWSEADDVVRDLTDLFWDAPRLQGGVYDQARYRLKESAGQDGRDDWGGIEGFLAVAHGCRVVPVWM